MSNYLNKCFLLVASMFPVMLFAQGGSYLVKGELSKLQTPVKVFFGYYFKDGYKEDSVVTKNGRFEFKGTVTEPFRGWLATKPAGAVVEPYIRNDQQELYVEKGIITVTGKDSIATATITGGIVNKTYQQLCTLMKPINKKRQEITDLFYAAPPEQRTTSAFREMLIAKEDTINIEHKRLLTAFVKENRNSVVCFLGIAALTGPNSSVDDVKALYKLLTKDVQQTMQGEQLAATIKKLRAIGIGATAPSFVQYDANEQPVKLEDFRGKYVLIDFWASWCKPCRADNPFLIKAYDKYRDRNFTILGITLDKKKDDWLTAIKEDGLSWTQVRDLKERNEAADIYYVGGIPQNFLIDPQGKIIAKDLHGEDLEKKLEALLGKN